MSEPAINDETTGDLAVVLGGGGARAAYQVGILRCLARHCPNLQISIITGVSAGAINAVYLASRTGSFRDTVEELSELWRHLRIEDVFEVNALSLGSHLLRWGGRLLSGGSPATPRVRGLVDTKPLERFLRRVYANPDGEILGIRQNLERQRLKAVAITTLNYSNGQTVTWVQGRAIETWERPNRRSVRTVLTPMHVMASSALPLVFPAIRLGPAWYGDGGIRLSAPLSPALHLGARRILAISTRYQKSFDEADQPAIHGYPPPAQVIGQLLNSVFLDVVDQDAGRLERLNSLLSKIPPENRAGFSKIGLVVIRPRQDLGRLAGHFEPHLPRAFRFLTRGLGTRETSSPDFLSLLMFQPDYLSALIELGEADAEARFPEIEELLGPEIVEQKAASGS